MYSTSLDSTYNTTTTTLTDAEAAGVLGGLMAFVGAIWFFALLVGVFMIIVMWKIFTKAGRKGWYAIVPFLNMYTLAEIVGIKGWIGIVAPLVAAVPVVGGIATLAFSIYQNYCLAKVYGKETSYVLGLIFLPIVFLPMLAFGSASYLGEGASPAKAVDFFASDAAKSGAAPAASAAAGAKKDEWVDGKEAK